MSALSFVLSFSGLASLTSVASFSTSADAAEVDCPTASEQGQKLRDQGKIMRAREMFLVCSRSTCPGVVRRDCVKWLPEVEESLPSIVLEAVDGQGNDVSAVKVSVDGTEITENLDGKPINVDPGQHVFKYEMAGAQPLTQTTTIRMGEKNRLLKVSFPAPPSAIKDKPPPPLPPPPPPSSPPILAYVLGGVGVVAFGSFAYFGITGKNDLSNLKNTCAPYCGSSQLTSVKTELTVADVSLGVGILALAGGAVAFFTHGSAKAEVKTTAFRVSPIVSPIPNGAAAGFSGSF